MASVEFTAFCSGRASDLADRLRRTMGVEEASTAYLSNGNPSKLVYCTARSETMRFLFRWDGKSAVYTPSLCAELSDIYRIEIDSALDN